MTRGSREGGSCVFISFSARTQLALRQNGTPYVIQTHATTAALLQLGERRNEGPKRVSLQLTARRFYRQSTSGLASGSSWYVFVLTSPEALHGMRVSTKMLVQLASLKRRTQ